MHIFTLRIHFAWASTLLFQGMAFEISLQSAKIWLEVDCLPGDNSSHSESLSLSGTHTELDEAGLITIFEGDFSVNFLFNGGEKSLPVSGSSHSLEKCDTGEEGSGSSSSLVLSRSIALDLESICFDPLLNNVSEVSTKHRGRSITESII